MGKSILPTLSTWWQWQGHFSDSVSNTSLGSVTTSMPASRTFTYPSSSMTVSGAAVTTAAAGSGSTAAGAGRQSCYWLICTFCDEQIDERFLVKYFMKIWFIILRIFLGGLDLTTGKTCKDYTDKTECNAASCGWNCTCAWETDYYNGGYACLPSNCNPPKIPCPSNYKCFDDSDTGTRSCLPNFCINYANATACNAAPIGCSWIQEQDTCFPVKCDSDKNPCPDPASYQCYCRNNDCSLKCCGPVHFESGTAQTTTPSNGPICTFVIGNM